MKLSEGSINVAEKIKKAIDDGEITNSEFDAIIMAADADGVIDPQEKRLLAQLHDMVSNGLVKRVPG